MRDQHSPTSFLRTVRLLLGASRRRSIGRRKRQQELLNQRKGKTARNVTGFGFVLAVLFMCVLNGTAAFVVSSAVRSGERLQVEHAGMIVVSDRFLASVNSSLSSYDVLSGAPDQAVPAFDYSDEAKRIAREFGGSPAAIEQKLRAAVHAHGARELVDEDSASPGLKALGAAGPFAAMLGSLALLWWAVMLVFQGEGLEFDLQRRRHPMWEWLFSHPVPGGAIFLAEMLSPIAANPIYWSAPLFPAILYGRIYGVGWGALAAVLVGVPISLAAACLGKALEIAVVLRFPPRSRGAVIGIMSWISYASLMLLLIGMSAIPMIMTGIGTHLAFLAMLPWPWLRLFLGESASGSFSFLFGVLSCWLVAAITIGGAIWFSIWGAQRGLSGNFAAEAGPGAPKAGQIRFGREPLYRKEFLWFVRDRSAIVQTILIPLTVAGFQAFNLRTVLSRAQGDWNYLCGVAILFGTYFLWILGPKSLASEGSALWIAQTWPRGLESLLKAKAWLWSLISSGIVALVLGYAIFLYPASAWKIALVGVGWFFFGRSMAEKSVTLVSVVSASGEVERIPWGRRGAAQLGMVTFSIGVLTQQWHIAVMGIVYSYLTAAAIWQNFRARLPYLYDPWSERMPPPPTLMHAMIAISILVEGVAVVSGILAAIFGRNNIAVAQSASYAVCSVLVAAFTARFLRKRGVRAQDVWCWRDAPISAAAHEPWWRAYGWDGVKTLQALLAGVIGGAALGLFAHGYLAAVEHIPVAAEILRRSQEQMTKIANLRVSYAVMAVLFAPLAEEYLFRGLLFRALDREWGGWRALVGSAAFFAIYHPPLAWPPVFLLGVTNAVLFKKTRQLAPAVLLHMAYNAVVSL